MMPAPFFFDTLQYGLFPAAGWDAGSTGTFSSNTGPFSDRCATNPGAAGVNTLLRTLGANVPTVVLGFWFKLTGTANARNIWVFRDGASVQCSLGIDATDHLLVRNGTAGTIHATAGTALAQNVWYFIEIKVAVAQSGSFTVKQDGLSLITGSGVDLTTTANDYCTNVCWPQGNSATNGAIGSLYILDTAAAAPRNDFLNPVKGLLLAPDGDGNYTQWTPNASTRFSRVNQTPTSDDDTTYISDNTAGHKNSVTIGNLPAGVTTIHALAHYWQARRDDAGPHTARAGLRISGTDYMAATESIAATFINYSYVLEQNPATSADWANSGVNGLEHVVEVVT